MYRVCLTSKQITLKIIGTYRFVSLYTHVGQVKYFFFRLCIGSASLLLFIKCLFDGIHRYLYLECFFFVFFSYPTVSGIIIIIRSSVEEFFVVDRQHMTMLFSNTSNNETYTYPIVIIRLYYIVVFHR